MAPQLIEHLRLLVLDSNPAPGQGVEQPRRWTFDLRPLRPERFAEGTLTVETAVL